MWTRCCMRSSWRMDDRSPQSSVLSLQSTIKPGLKLYAWKPEASAKPEAPEPEA